MKIVSGDPRIIVDGTAAGYSIRLNDMEPIKAVITGSFVIGSNTFYTWQEVRARKDGGGYETYAGARTGTSDNGYAAELNNSPNVASGTIVIMWRRVICNTALLGYGGKWLLLHEFDRSYNPAPISGSGSGSGESGSGSGESGSISGESGSASGSIESGSIQSGSEFYSGVVSGSAESGSISGSLQSGSLQSGSLESGSLESGSLESGSISGSVDSGSLESGSAGSLSGSLESGSISGPMSGSEYGPVSGESGSTPCGGSGVLTIEVVTDVQCINGNIVVTKQTIAIPGGVIC